MLVLERKIKQRIRVGKNVWITIMGISQNGRVSVGIDAPKCIPILREEMLTEEQHREGTFWVIRSFMDDREVYYAGAGLWTDNYFSAQQYQSFADADHSFKHLASFKDESPSCIYQKMQIIPSNRS